MTADRPDRADAEARAASAAQRFVQFGKERPADARAKTDRLHRTAFAAGLAGDVPPRQAGIVDAGHMREASRPLLDEDGRGTGGGAFPAEGAFAARKIDRRHAA